MPTLGQLTVVADDAQGKTWIDPAKITSINVYGEDGGTRFHVYLYTGSAMVEARLDATNGDGTYASKQDALDAVMALLG